MSDQTSNQPYNVAQRINAFDQCPVSGSAIVGASPLHHVNLPELAVAQLGTKANIELTELALRSHLLLRGKPDNSDFVQGVKAVLGLELPGVLKMQVDGALSIRWISPDEWLVVAPAARGFELEQGLIDAVQGHCAIVNVSGGQTILRLAGVDAQQVLQKSVPLDVHPKSFPIGKVVTTVFAKTQAVISRTAEHEWELVIRRSFADYVWLWLQDCCAEFELVIKQDETRA